MTSAKLITITGTVQGVGFRPFVYREAVARALCGWVLNNPQGVVIHAEGKPEDIDAFIAALRAKAPAAAILSSVRAEDCSPENFMQFTIRKSAYSGAFSAAIPVDMALCPDCAREMRDKADRHYHYPFTNCTNCGPRYTIVRALPYDRPQTSMVAFEMCSDCRKEYENPLNRRFHAQPVACPKCGPRVTFEMNGEKCEGPEAIARTARLIADGGIAAIKSLGGFHLACRADSQKAVARLRAAKKRPHKPFAVMVRDIAAARLLCHISADEEKLLCGVRAPVVMLAKRLPEPCPAAAPALSRLGVMLAYTPLHLALFEELAANGFDGALVMTSANRIDEPICTDNEEAARVLSGIADAFLFHNRPIVNRCDDSVAFVCGGERVLRRARGYVPAPITIKNPSGKNVFAAGAELKNTFCLLRGSEAFLSPHIGDMDDLKCERFYREAFANMKSLLGAEPEIFACDLHPAYASSAVAHELGKPIEVQHHFAHIASVIAEHGIDEPVIGAAFDGTGAGTDGTVWGCEFMVCEGVKWRRAASLLQVPLAGGDLAAREIWRNGLAWTLNMFGKNWREKCGGIFENIDEAALSAAERLCLTGFNSPLTSSMGRLFDAAAFFAGVRESVSYEAQAAMEFEALCAAPVLRWHFALEREKDLLRINPKPFFEKLIAEHPSPAEASALFHGAVIDMTAAVFRELRAATGIKKAALSGGVFQNMTILSGATAALEADGFTVYTNRLVPANDGGVSLGQAWAAANSQI